MTKGVVQLSERTLAFTSGGIDKLGALCDYVIDAEGEDFEQWLSEGNDPQGHIFHIAMSIKMFLEGGDE